MQHRQRLLGSFFLAHQRIDLLLQRARGVLQGIDERLGQRRGRWQGRHEVQDVFQPVREFADAADANHCGNAFEGVRNPAGFGQGRSLAVLLCYSLHHQGRQAGSLVGGIAHEGFVHTRVYIAGHV